MHRDHSRMSSQLHITRSIESIDGLLEITNHLPQLFVILLCTALSPTTAAQSINLQHSTRPESNATPIISHGMPPPVDINSCQSESRGHELQIENSSVFLPLSKIDSPHLTGVLEKGAPTLNWWLRSQNEISHVTIAVATHETTHWIKKKLTACSGGAQTYYFNGKIWATNLRQGETRHISIALRTLPTRYINKQTRRLERYLLLSQRTPGNQFTVLLDELLAYIGSAQTELALVEAQRSDLVASGIKIFEGNISGSTELLLFTLAYLTSLEEASPYEHEVLISTPGVLPLLRNAWAVHLENISRLERLGDDFQKALSPDFDITREIFSLKFKGALQLISRN